MVVEFGEEIDPRTNLLVLELEKKIRGERLPGIEETVPTYRSLFISFDPQKFSHHQLKEKLQGMISTLEIENCKEGRLVQIPVVYGGEFGPDLQGVAEMKGLAQEEVIRLHTSREFRVFMIGFTPGFPYLGVLPPEIAVPRLETPRLKVPKGSVGIAELQTGIYPLESPGGWRIIGRTPLQLFNPETNPPFLLSPGDRVRFFPISPKEYQELLQDGSL
jgi:KipI family sensor histidine kinase inhibitor